MRSLLLTDHAWLRDNYARAHAGNSLEVFAQADRRFVQCTRNAVGGLLVDCHRTLQLRVQEELHLLALVLERPLDLTPAKLRIDPSILCSVHLELNTAALGARQTVGHSSRWACRASHAAQR